METCASRSWSKMSFPAQRSQKRFAILGKNSCETATNISGAPEFCRQMTLKKKDREMLREDGE